MKLWEQVFYEQVFCFHTGQGFCSVTYFTKKRLDKSIYPCYTYRVSNNTRKGKHEGQQID